MEALTTHMNTMTQILVGGAGGLLLSIYVVVIERNGQRVSERAPIDSLYVCTCIIYPVIGAFFAGLYAMDSVKLTAWTSLHVGLTSPVTLKGLVNLQAKRPVDPGAGA
jgi:hypothetical protein